MNNQTHLLFLFANQNVKKIKHPESKIEGKASVILRTIDPAIVKTPTTKQINGTLLNLKILAIKTANKIIENAIIQTLRLELKSFLYHGKGTFSTKV